MEILSSKNTGVLYKNLLMIEVYLQCYLTSCKICQVPGKQKMENWRTLMLVLHFTIILYYQWKLAIGSEFVSVFVYICQWCLNVCDVVIGHFWSAKITLLYARLEITKITSAGIIFHPKFKDSSHQGSYSSLPICIVRCFEVHILWVSHVWFCFFSSSSYSLSVFQSVNYSFVRQHPHIF